jgi:hypothetical protein
VSVLRVIFPQPGFFLGDARMRLAVNGHLVLDTSFMGGFDWWAEMPPGWHTVEATIVTPLGFSRKKTYQLEVRPELVTIAVLAHSRMWGNMTETAKSVTFVPR